MSNWKRNNPKKTRFYKNAKGFIKGVGQVANIAGKALSLATTIASVINAEHKHVDTISNHGVNNATPTITCLTNMAQGTTDQTRTGNSILAKHMYIKGVIIRNASAGATVYEQVRTMLILDTNDENDTAPTIDLLLQNYSTAYCGISMHNKNYTDRFKVLYDKTTTLSVYQPIKKWKYYKIFKVKTYQGQGGKSVIRAVHMTYNGVNSTDLSKNHIYLVEISNVDTNTPTQVSHVRFGYVDN